MLPVSQKDAGGRLLRALRSAGPELSRIALGARTAIAASEVLPTAIFEQLVRMQVESEEEVAVLVACACAFNAAVADCGWDSTTALHYFTSMWSHRFLFVMRSAEMNKRDTIEVGMIISECTASPSVVVKCLPWAASQSVQLVRSQIIADSDAHTVARASRNLEEEPRGKSKETIAVSCTATSGAVLVALLSKVSTGDCSLAFEDVRDIIQQCLCLLQEAVRSPSAKVRDFATTSLLPSLLPIAGAMPGACTLIFSGVMEALELLSASSDIGIRRARFAVLLELTQHALHLKPLSDLLVQAERLEPYLLEGLASRATLTCKQARQAMQDLLHLQCTSVAPGPNGPALAAVQALLAMFDGLAMYELRLVRGTWAVHWPVFLQSCADFASAQQSGTSAGVAASSQWQAGLAGDRLQMQYMAIVLERALQHTNPAVQQFAAVAAADMLCSGDVAAAMHVPPQWLAGHLGQLLVGVPGCLLPLQVAEQIAERACAPGDWRELMLQQGQFAPWAAKVMWEADPIEDTSPAICHLFSTHAAAIVMHGEGAAAVGDLCSLMGARKVPQMAAALLCQVLAAVLTSAAEVPWDTFLAAAAHAGTAVSAAHARHGMEGAGMAAVIIEAACSAGLRRGGVVGVLRTLLPHLPPGSLAPEAQGVLRAVLVQAVTAAPETAAEIVEDLDTEFNSSAKASSTPRCMVMVMDRLRSRGVALITAAQLASLLDSVPSELEQQLDRTIGLLPHALDDMHRRPYLSAGAAQTTLLLLHAVLFACVVNEGAAPGAGTEPSQPCQPSQHGHPEQQQPRERRLEGAATSENKTLSRVPLRRAVVRQAAVFLPALAALACAAAHKARQLLESGPMASATNQSKERPEQAHWSPPVDSATTSVMPTELWPDLHKAAMLTDAVADSLRLVLAAAPQEPRITAACIQDAVQSCLHVACTLAPLALNRQAQDSACAARREVQGWAGYATAKLLHAVAAFPPLVAWQQLHAVHAPPKVSLGGRHPGHTGNSRLAGLAIGRDMHTQVAQLQGICMHGLAGGAPAPSSTDHERARHAASATQEALLPWGILDGAMQIFEGVRNTGPLVSRHGNGRPGRERQEVAMPLQPSLLTAALAVLPLAAERDVVYALRCLRACIACMLEGPDGKALAADSWQLLQRSSLAPLAADVSREYSSSEPLVLLMAAICKQCLHVVERKRMRRPAVCAAMLSLCLARSFFDKSVQGDFCSEISALHADTGPVRKLVSQLLAVGAQSSALINLTSVQLCSRLLLAPELVPRYADEIVTLLLFGGSQGSASTLATKDGVLASEIAQVSESWVAMTGTAMPEEQQGTSGARIAAVLFCQTLVDMYMAKRAGVATPDSGRAAAVRAGGLLLGRIAEVSRADEAVVGAVPFKGSAVHRKKTRVWQALAVLAQFSEAAPGTLTVEEVLSTLQQREIASVKQYQEAVLLLLLEGNPELCREHLLPVLSDYSRPQHDGLASIMLVCAIASASFPRHGFSVPSLGAPDPGAADTDPQTAFVQDLVAAVLPHISTHHHQTRCFAHLVLHGLLREYPYLTTSAAGVGTAALQALLRFTETNPHAQRLLEVCPMSFAICARDLCHPRLVLRSGTVLLGGTDPEPVECAPGAALDRIAAFLEMERRKLREGAAVDAPMAATAATPAAGEGVEQARETYQRKIEPWRHLGAAGMLEEERLLHTLGCAVDALVPHSWRTHDGRALSDDWDNSGTGFARSRRGSELIVVASLIDKATNLGGLARTCEIFAAQHLIVADIAVLQHRDFTLLSMHAEKWLSVRGVAVADLQQWLQARKADGYAIIGVEQTSGSVSLPEFAFEQRTVLLLGNEMTGIPADLLRVMDTCVEIPQLGTLLSLNAHVSGAISVYEFTRQLTLAGL